MDDDKVITSQVWDKKETYGRTNFEIEQAKWVQHACVG